VLAAPLRAGEPVTDVRLLGPGLTALLPPGRVAAPVRLADLAVAGLAAAGDRVDVLATAPGAVRAEVVASGALVLAAPGGEGDGDDGGAADGGLLVLAVDEATAATLAAAATTATLTLSLPGAA
jgi:pilus assembly protein CpaB